MFFSAAKNKKFTDQFWVFEIFNIDAQQLAHQHISKSAH
jgi:hypothetical protein